ncbi:MAG: thiamine diphosphokinase [Ignavibacteriales bacterium UTCHB1]|nr:MAG: thiamine diphosphokinase [Ignavibacteriales bacterium UTCHB1]
MSLRIFKFLFVCNRFNLFTCMIKRSVIFLNGVICKSKIINYYLSKKSFLVCVDGAGNYLKRLNIIPDIVIGDLDSITATNLNYFKKRRVEILRITEQETTDFEKSLMYLKAHNCSDVTVIGAMSNRTDHTLNNFSVMKRYSDKMNIKMVDDKFEVSFVTKSINFKTVPGETVSFIGFPVARGVTTSGLEFPLNNEDLEFGIKEGTLNRATSRKIAINFTSGDLLIFKEHHLS